MNKIIWCAAAAIALTAASLAYGQQGTKLTELTDMSSNAVGADLLYIVDDPSGTPLSKKVSLTNLFGNLKVATTISVGSATALVVETSGGVDVLAVDTSTPQVTVTGDGTAAFRVLQADAGVVLTLDTLETYSGTGTATGGAGRLYIGTKTSSNDDSGVCVGRNVVGTDLFSHAFRDESDFTSSNTGAYAAFDSDYDVEGSLSYAHYYSYQSRMDHRSSGTAALGASFVSAPVVSTGTVTSLNGLRIYNATGAGTVTTQYGIYIEDLTKGGTDYAIYSAGSAASYHGGNWQVGGTVVATGTVTGSNLAGTAARQEVCVGFSVGSGGYYNTVVGYEAGQGIQADAQYNCLFGRHAGNDVTTGDQNIFIGGLSGDNCTTGSANIVIGHNINTPAVDSTNYLNLGGVLTANTSTLAVTFTGAVTTTGVVTIPAGAVGAPSLTTTGDTNTGLYFPAADTVAVTTGGVQRVEVNTTGVLLRGAVVGDLRLGQSLAIANQSSYGGISLANYSNTSWGALLDFKKSRNGTVGSHTVVADDDTIGDIHYLASDGTDYSQAALIRGRIDGSPGNNDTPGAIEFWTTSDGYASSTLAVTIDSRQNVGIGVTPSTWYGTYVAQQLKGVGAIRGTTNVLGLSYNGLFNAGAGWERLAADYCFDAYMTAGTMVFRTAGTAAAGSAISWTTAATIANDGDITAGTAGSWALQNVAASSTVPTLIPTQTDTTTGLGSLAAGIINFVCAGVTSVSIKNVTRTDAGYDGVYSDWVSGTRTQNNGGTLARETFHRWQQPTLASSAGAMTVTDAATLYIAGQPAAGTDMTITNPWALWVDAGNCRFDGNVGIGVTATPTVPLTLGPTTGAKVELYYGGNYTLGVESNEFRISVGSAIGTFSFYSNGHSGSKLYTLNAIWTPHATTPTGLLNLAAQTRNSTAAAATYAIGAIINYDTPTLTATNAITVTDLATLRIASAPTASTNVTATNSWALWIDSGNCRLDGNVCIPTKPSGNLAGGLCIGNGTAASASTADAVQLWAADAGGLAGHSGLAMRGEDDAANTVVVGYKEESADAETPQANAQPGTICKFTDSGDGSGDGIYILGLDGTTWTQID